MPLHRFDRTTLPATPWKNGGGVTREIACMPAGAGLEDFDWRISIAHVASDGPFSAYPGVDRVIALLEGAGMRLSTPDGAIDHCLRERLVPWAFAGEAAIRSELLGGDCDDFNVMTRRARCRARVEALRASQALPEARAGVLLASGGCVQLDSRDGRSVRLPPGHGLWWHDEPMAWQIHFEPGAALLAATLHSLDHD